MACSCLVRLLLSSRAALIAENLFLSQTARSVSETDEEALTLHRCHTRAHGLAHQFLDWLAIAALIAKHESKRIFKTTMIELDTRLRYRELTNIYNKYEINKNRRN